jgi:hypothetical protein
VAWQVNQPVLAWCIVAAQMVGIWLALRSAFLIDIRELSGLRQLDTDARRVQKDPRDASGAEGQVLSDPPSASGTVGQVLSDQPSASDAVGRVLSDPPVPPIEFKTRGPYGWVRHPIYSGWFLIVFAVPVMTLTRLVFAVTSSVYLLIAIPFEERSLRRSSQGAYDQYTRKVRWRLVPRLF